MVTDPQQLEKMLDVLVVSGKKIEGHAAYFTMALGALMAVSALTIIGALTSGTWDPNWGLALGIVVALLVSSSIISIGGLLAATWVYGLTYRALNKSTEEYTRRDLARTHVEQTIADTNKQHAENEAGNGGP